MHINQNLSAIIANNHLLSTESNLQTSVARLSSGYRINHAKDDPAGMAISNRMQQQIDALNQASRNALDGTSALDTADGALNEVSSILQRMRELSVQAASDTNTTLDKTAAQQEVASLQKEIDRISSDTEFNTKALLDGSLDTRVYSTKVTATVNGVTVNQDVAENMDISDDVPVAKYNMSVSNGTQASYTTNAADNTAYPYTTDGVVKINGYSVEINASDTATEQFEKIRNAAENGNCTATIDIATNKITINSNAYGSMAEVDYSFTDTAGTVNKPATIPTGTDASVTLGSGFSSTATASTSGNTVTVTDAGGFSMVFDINANVTTSIATPQDLELDVTAKGTMDIQVGSNQDQMVNIRIPKITTESLGIDDVDVTTVNGASRSITAMDSAIAKVTAVRSKIGAYENRLDYTKDTLDQTSENLTGAISRIKDIDMATEMTTYSQDQVLQQAATSVLSQANDLPQQVLQLLRN